MCPDCTVSISQTCRHPLPPPHLFGAVPQSSLRGHLLVLSLQIKQKLTGTLCIIISVDCFGDHEETQTRLSFAWTLWGSRALGTSKTSRVSCVCLHSRWVQMNLSRLFLVLMSPDYWLMILSFTWQCIIDNCSPLPHLPEVGRHWEVGWKRLEKSGLDD